MFNDEERTGVSDEEMKTNRGEEVSERRMTGSLSHARKNGPSPTKLIFYPFFYCQGHGRDGKVIAVTEVVSGKMTPVRTNEPNVHTGILAILSPSAFRHRVSAGGFIPTRTRMP